MGLGSRALVGVHACPIVFLEPFIQHLFYGLSLRGAELLARPSTSSVYKLAAIKSSGVGFPLFGAGFTAATSSVLVLTCCRLRQMIAVTLLTSFSSISNKNGSQSSFQTRTFRSVTTAFMCHAKCQ